jgi:hypothetical protein
MNGFNALVVQTGRSQIYTSFITPNNGTPGCNMQSGGTGFDFYAHNWPSCCITFSRRTDRQQNCHRGFIYTIIFVLSYTSICSNFDTFHNFRITRLIHTK